MLTLEVLRFAGVQSRGHLRISEIYFIIVSLVLVLVLVERLNTFKFCDWPCATAYMKMQASLGGIL